MAANPGCRAVPGTAATKNGLPSIKPTAWVTDFSISFGPASSRATAVNSVVPRMAGSHGWPRSLCRALPRLEHLTWTPMATCSSVAQQVDSGAFARQMHRLEAKHRPLTGTQRSTLAAASFRVVLMELDFAGKRFWQWTVPGQRLTITFTCWQA